MKQTDPSRLSVCCSSRAPAAPLVIVTTAFAALTLAGCTTMTREPPAQAAAVTASAAAPTTVLWVGNSFFYYNSMHGHVGRMLAAADPDEKGYRSTSATISGSGMNWHDIDALFKPNAVASYSFESVYRKSPVGNGYSARLSGDVAAHLQRVAWETVQANRK